VYVPAKSAKMVTEGNLPATEAEAVKFLRMDGTVAVFEIASGRYHFQVSGTG
jgi:alpha-L-rhamnosidase